MPNRKRLYRKIYDEISHLIDAGEFIPGNRLPTERALAERFHVSRPTIREAIIALEATGKVLVKTGSGVYVLEAKKNNNPLQEISPFEVLEARVLLEGEAAALAAKMITKDECVLLQQAFLRLEKESQSSKASDADREFHSIIANATHNNILAKQINELWELQESSTHIKEAHSTACSSIDKERIDEHQKIMLSIINRDPIKARKAMHNHFSNILENMHASLEEEALQAAKLKGSMMRERFSFDLYAPTE